MSNTLTSVPAAQPTSSSASGKQVALLAQTRRPLLEVALAVAIYFGFACLLTWPLILHMANNVYAVSGDPYGTMAFYRELIEHHQSLFQPGAMHQFGFPEGLPIRWPINLASAPSVLSLYLLARVFGAVPALDIYTLSGYVLTGTVTFLFARRLTKNVWASLIAGWAFAFYPFAALNGLGHVDNVHGWVFALAVWRMVELLLKPTRRNGILAGIAAAFSMWWSPYFILFGGTAYVTVTAAALFFAWRDGKLREILIPQTIAASILVVFLICLGALSTVGTTEGIGVRPHSIQDLYIYAARPLEYLMPDRMSPIFGADTHNYLQTHEHGSGSLEDTLYLGVTVMLLALVSFWALVHHQLTGFLRRGVIVMWLLAAAAIITSMQPKTRMLGVTVPFPAHFISFITETWRVYSRFVMVVMLAVSVLAAVGLDVLTRKRGQWARIAIMSLATVLVPLDLWTPAGKHVTKISVPGIYRALERQPKGLVAEYPLAPGGGNLYEDLFYHNIYDMPMINGYGEGSIQEVRAYSLLNLANPSTTQRLATLGVRYVIVDTERENWGWPTSGKPGPGLRLIAHEPHADLYVVTAHPQSQALVTPGEGFLPPWHTTSERFTLLTTPSGTIELAGACAECDGVLSMTLIPISQPHEVTVHDGKGHVIYQQTIAGRARVKLGLRFSKHTNITIAATPGPEPIEGPGNVSASIEVTDIEFTSNLSPGVRNLVSIPKNKGTP